MKNSNDDARDCTCKNMHDANMLEKPHQCQEQLLSTDDVDLAHFRNVLSEQNHCKKQRLYDSVQKHITTNHITKSHNTSMKIRGICCAPLLLGQVQIGKVTNAHRELVIE